MVWKFLVLAIVAAVLVLIIILYNKKMNGTTSGSSAPSKKVKMPSKKAVAKIPAAHTQLPVVDDTLIDFDHFDNSRSILSSDDVASALAADGYDPNRLDHFFVEDAGHGVYVRSFYIEAVPKRVTFADTFAVLFNFPNVTSSVFISPMVDGKASRLLDRKIISDETEVIGANKAGDRNRERKMQQILDRDEEWASQIETGNNSLYEVGFLFSLHADSLKDLDLVSADFISAGKERSIELCSCYGMQAEAYLSNSPCNRVQSGALGMLKSMPIKLHPFDKYGVATLFNHTNTYFSHATGIPIGRNLLTGEPVSYDPYAKSHNGFSIIFVGATGTGKSCSIKIFASRLECFGYRFACIDTEKSGGRGEYSALCDTLGGINFQLRTNSENRLNIFEVDEQFEIDQRLGKEVRNLRLIDKCSDVRNILMTAITGTKELPDFKLATSMEKILMDCILDIYREKGIIDGDPDSLYMDSADLDGNRTRKELPTMKDCYLWILRHQRNNQNDLHKQAYQILVDSLSDFVDDLMYDADTLVQISKETYMKATADSRNVRRLRGARGYFDGQSTVHINRNTSFINIDISDLPKEDKLIGQQVAMNFLVENYIKKNSENIRNAQKIVLIVDEAHRMFPYESSRRFLSDQVRTARKNNASMWICTQALKDFDVTDDTRAILKNVCSIFMLKQSGLDRKFLLENTPLTESMVSRVISLGGDPNDLEDRSHKGEVALIDNDSTVIFLKIDYLEKTERMFAETDVAKQQAMETSRIV